MPQSEFWPFTRNKVPTVGFDASSVMHKQLGDMEGQVKEIQMELAAIKRDRMDLLTQQKIETTKPEGDTALTTMAPNTEIQENDYQAISEVAKLREELNKARSVADEERVKREKYERKLKDLELKLSDIHHTGILTEAKKSRKNTEEELDLKKQLRDVKEALEESNFIVNEKTEELHEYRVKYLQAQQQVEELKRQLDIVENDNKQVSDQLQVEIQRMKLQFQEKLQELVPLPDLLKGAQIQLEEAKQLQRLAEDTSEQLSKELHHVKEKLTIAVNNYNQAKLENGNLLEEVTTYKADIDQKIKEIDEDMKKMDDYKCQILRLEEKLGQGEILYNEKSSECARLIETMNETREENARNKERHKVRTETMRRYFQTQIADLERQVSYSRAQCKAAHKEKEDIRQHMQIQINNLQESFELAAMRLRALHTQVTSTMNASLVLLAEDEDF